MHDTGQGHRSRAQGEVGEAWGGTHDSSDETCNGSKRVSGLEWAKMVAAEGVVSAQGCVWVGVVAPLSRLRATLTHTQAHTVTQSRQQSIAKCNTR